MLANRILCFLLLFFPEPVSAVASTTEDNLKQRLFLTAEVNNPAPYPGEEIELIYTLFFRRIAPKIKDVDKPVHQGIWAEDHSPEGLIPSRPDVNNGSDYRSAVIKRMKLVPLQSGKLSVTGYRLLCTLPRDLSFSQKSAPDDSLTLIAPDVILQVRQLPEPKPGGFRGAVGSYTAMASIERDTVPAGMPVTLTTVISGQGSFRTLPDIPITLPTGFTRIETDTSDKLYRDLEQTSGYLSSMVTFRAEKPGTYTFSPVSFSAFDPSRKTYSTISSEALTLTVLPHVRSTADNLQVPTQETPLPEDTSRYSPAWNLVLPAITVALITTLLYIFLKKCSRRPYRHKQTNGNAQPLTLPELRETLETAIENSNGIHPQSLTRSELKQALVKQGVEKELSNELFSLLDQIDKARFSPGEPGENELEKLRQTYRTVIEKLRKR